jgi:hypothetical protein
LELATIANLVFINYDTKRGELFYFKAPYHRATDFVREPIIDGKRKNWGAEYLLVCARATLLELYRTMTEIFGEEWCKPAGQAMVDADLGLYWKSHE